MTLPTNISLAPQSPIVKFIIKKVFETRVPLATIRPRNLIDSGIVPSISREQLIANGMQESFIVGEIAQPQFPESQKAFAKYSKIFDLLRDPFLTHVLCSGETLPLEVIKNGQKQRTRIFLKKEEINEFFKYASERTRIPIINGVFKVMFDNFVLNGIISDEIGEKFIIKKIISRRVEGFK